MRRQPTCAALVLLAACCAAGLQAHIVHARGDFKPGTVIELTDSTFDAAVQEGVWLVDVFATWCSHCRQLEPIWRAVAEELKHDAAVHVAKVEGPKNRALMSRLQVEAFPSIYLLRDRRMWVYMGPRNSDAIIAFATAGYKAATPLPQHRCPNHPLGRALGLVHRVPGWVHEAYLHLKEERGWSDLGILVAALAVPLVSGVCTLCLMDAMYVRQAKLAEEDADVSEAAPLAVPAQAAGDGAGGPDAQEGR